MASLVRYRLQEYLNIFINLLHPYLLSIEEHANILMLPLVFFTHFSSQHIVH